MAHVRTERSLRHASSRFIPLSLCRAPNDSHAGVGNAQGVDRRIDFRLVGVPPERRGGLAHDRDRERSAPREVDRVAGANRRLRAPSDCLQGRVSGRKGGRGFEKLATGEHGGIINRARGVGKGAAMARTVEQEANRGGPERESCRPPGGPRARTCSARGSGRGGYQSARRRRR